eukprot:sb/3478307/
MINRMTERTVPTMKTPNPTAKPIPPAAALTSLTVLGKRVLIGPAECTYQEPTEISKQQIRTRYLGHVTCYQPIRDQYFLIPNSPTHTDALHESEEYHAPTS